VSLRHLWAFLAVALPILGALVAALPSTDLTYHLRAGAEVLDTGQIPARDGWTFTARGLPWVDQQWGGQVLLELVFRAGGWVGLVVLRAALVGWIFGALFELCRRHGLGLRVASWLTLGAFVVTMPALALRPQLLGMALFAVTLLLVAGRHEHPRRLWLVPVVTLLWANLHGSFFLGPVVLGLVWLADLGETGRRRHLPLVVAMVSLVTACVTPFGPAVWSYAVGVGASPEISRRITEWQPPSLRDVTGIVFFASMLLVAAFLARRDRPVPWATLAWLGFFLLIGLYAVRGVAWWPMAAVAAIATLVEPGRGLPANRLEPRAIRLANGGLAAALVVAGIALLPLWRPIDENLGAPVGVVSQAPAEITGELRRIALPADRLFNPQRWGSWFEFAIPELPVAIDSRIELFPAEIWDAYSTVEAGGSGWDAVLERWAVTIIVTATDEDAPIVDRLHASGWRTELSTGDGTILVRADRP
jgi:hypothetical protein